ncbi:MAG: acetyl-CoA carboxylase carboxyltransferase subunit beta [Chloroflexi bacterium]|nr:acetyl-CoA carboxylase carboxyltransferase subunit beta [Chloroflexota bacterium]
MRELLRRHQPTVLGEANQAGREVPDNLWVKCPQCKDLIYVKEFERNARVCQKCRYHARLSARDRIALLADGGAFVEHDADLWPDDPLGFVGGSESYRDKLVQTQARTGLADALVCGALTIGDQPAEVAVADFAFLGASMGSVFGEKLVRASDRALARGVPLLTVSASGGARMHEGTLALMQMAKTSAALAELAAVRLPHIALLTDPCFGGVTASYAMQADVILAEPGAMIGFAGPRVIEQTIRQKLPEGFQTAEFLLQHGMLDAIVPRRELPGYLTTLLSLYRGEAPHDAIA